MKTPIEFSNAELNEIQDALQTDIQRMCEVGQTAQEIEYQSLANAWSARKKVIVYLMPEPLPAWFEKTEQQVQQALAHPVLLVQH